MTEQNGTTQSHDSVIATQRNGQTIVGENVKYNLFALSP